MSRHTPISIVHRASTRILLFTFCLLLCVCTACIKNDIPYPRIHANITSIEARGQSQAASIDSTHRVATLYLPEDVDIYRVQIASYTLTPGAEIVTGSLDSPLDLSSDYTLTLRIYQDYEWTIRAIQPIDRAFTLEGQVGQSVIDPEAHTVTAEVSKSTPLDAVRVIACKLAGPTATYSPSIAGGVVDFTSPVAVDVTNFGHTERWTITVTQAEQAVTTLSVDAWTCVAWVYGQAEAGAAHGVQYRIKGDTGWIDAPQGWITDEGGAFHARLGNLTPLTEYEARATSGDHVGETLTFTTGAEAQMPNSDFDQWWLDGKVWCPWAEGGTPYWDTGNKGAATLGQSNSVPTDDTVDGHGKAAMLQTKFIGIGFLGKLGAGNIFVGRYVRTDGTNGVLSFGREFTERPTHLTGYLKYHNVPISHTTTGFEDLKGRPDTCTVWIALIDSPEPFEIRTNPADRQLFDPEGDEVIAYGIYQSGDPIEAYMPFDIELRYRSTSRVPRYIICAASASKYGDYFTGGNGSVLYVDDFALTYR